MLQTGEPVFSADRLAQLAPAERRVAEYLMHAGPEALVLSAAVLADRLGTSDATVVRTAKALGYSGLGQLRQALAAHHPEPLLAERLRRTLARTAPHELLQVGVSNHLTALEDLTRRIAPERFEGAARLLAGGRRVVWRGVGPSASLADYARLLCQRIGRASVAFTHTGTSFADELLTLTGDDVIAALAYGRAQRDVEVLLERAASIGAPVVLITDAGGRQPDVRVHTVLESGRGAPGLFASHATTVVVIEALILGIAATDEPGAEASLVTLNGLRATLAGRRLDVDSP